MDDWFLYILKCNDESLYTGITTDVERRVAEHQEGGSKAAKYTRGRTPVELIFYEAVGNKSEALKIEKAVKALPKVDKKRLIDKTILIDDLRNEH